jgi:hypothetical protein
MAIAALPDTVKDESNMKQQYLTSNYGRKDAKGDRRGEKGDRKGGKDDRKGGKGDRKGTKGAREARAVTAVEDAVEARGGPPEEKFALPGV